MALWFVSDTHFNHEKIMNLAQRPYDCVEDMNTSLIDLWNDKIGKKDVVYHLGDIALTKSGKRGEEYLRHLKDVLNGEIRLMLGNHDDRKLCEKVFGDTWMPRGLWRIRHERERIVLCHYALRTWEGQHYGAWHLHGHSHGALTPYGKSADLGVDCDFVPRQEPAYWGTPYSFAEIKSFMDNRQVAVPDEHQKAARR